MRPPIHLQAMIAAGALSLIPVASMAQSVALPTDKIAFTLNNGQYGWDEAKLAAAKGGTVELVISIPSQMAYVFQGGTLVGATTVSTGKPGKATPTGEFGILQKRVFHRSNLYSNAPMPFMQRLTWTGIAIHGGDLPGYPASHGCIRMPNAFAKRLFDLTSMGGRVLVTDQRMPDDAGPPPPPPVLIASADQYESARFAGVTIGATLVGAPGETVFGPSRAVIQPVADTRR